MTRAYSIVWKDFVEALPKKKNGSIEGNVPLSQAAKKKSRSPWNEDNVSMCVFIMLSYFKRHSNPAFSRRFMSAFESVLLGVPPSLIAL